MADSRPPTSLIYGGWKTAIRDLCLLRCLLCDSAECFCVLFSLLHRPLKALRLSPLSFALSPLWHLQRWRIFTGGMKIVESEEVSVDANAASLLFHTVVKIASSLVAEGKSELCWSSRTQVTDCWQQKIWLRESHFTFSWEASYTSFMSVYLLKLWCAVTNTSAMASPLLS